MMLMREQNSYCEMSCFFFNGICRNIRMDTLAQILTYGNVHAFTNVAVVDTCSGLVVGAVLERQGGKEISYTCS